MDVNSTITFKGNPLTLIGPVIKVGDNAPEFTVLDSELKPLSLSQFKGQKVILSIVPSLDTPVCEIQTKKFNQEAALLNAKILTISMDLPFAQKRFCDSLKINHVLVLSDYKDRDFATKYGLLIKELGLLARAVIIISPNSKVVYTEIVKEVTSEPNYKAAIEKVKTL